MKEFYLAHALESRKEVREWELRLEKRTGISLINPFYDVPRPDIEAMDAGLAVPLISANEIVERDLGLVKKASDGLVAIIDNSSTVGTIMEIVYAKKVFHHPVYLIVTNGKEKHHWLKYHADKIFTSKEEFEEWIENERN